jgi:phosphoribosylformylglycinamidine synthase
VVLLGEGLGELGGSEYLKVVHGIVAGRPPELDLERERALLALLAKAAEAGLLRSAHDCSDGGLAVTLAECAFDTGGIGVDADVPLPTSRPEAAVDAAGALFGESASRVVVSVNAADCDALLKAAADSGVPARRIGTTGGARLRIRVNGVDAIDCPVAEAEQVWSSSIGQQFARRVA